jgi:outer membrane protein assembly factor BamD
LLPKIYKKNPCALAKSNKKMKKFLLLSIISLAIIACSPFQKAMKSEDTAVKYAEAEKLYEKGKYSKSILLFEQLQQSYKGKPQAEKMFYMYSQALYKTKQFYAAGYQFEKFSSSYPKSEKVEEASYLGAFCYSKLSPVFSLDQTDTEKAIDKMQNFIDKFPESKYLAESNVIVKALREKIEKKAYENAREYNKISDYKSALVALDNFIADYPGTPYKEAALFYKLDSGYKLAINSIPSKMKERLDNSKILYNNLIKFNPNSEFKAKADDMLANIEKTLTTIAK